MKLPDDNFEPTDRHIEAARKFLANTPDVVITVACFLAHIDNCALEIATLEAQIKAYKMFVAQLCSPTTETP